MRFAEMGGSPEGEGRAEGDDRSLTRRELVERAGMLGAGAIGLPGILAACGGSSGGGKSSSASLSKPATKPSQIVIRTWGDPWQKTYAAGAVKDFTAKTGIPVKFDTSDYSQLQAKVREAVRAGRRPPVDLMLTIEPEAYLSNVQKLSVPFDGKLVPNAKSLPAFARSPGDGLSYLNVVSYSFPLVYVKTRVSLPKSVSWGELWKPKYRGRVFMSNNPPAMILPTAKMLGVDISGDITPVFDKLRQLRPNIAAVGDDAEFISLVQRGQVDLGPQLVAVAAEVKNLGWVVPKEGEYVPFESLYVPRGVPKASVYYAQVLANEILSSASQSAIAKGILEVPVNPAATLPSSMKGDPAFPFTPAEFKRYGIIPPIELIARKREEWVSGYNAAIGG